MRFGSDRGLKMCARHRHDHDRSGELNLHTESDTDFPKLSAPARRALTGAGYTHLEQLSKTSESDLRKLHGMGPRALSALRAALHERGLAFRD
jgi:hypothetical protein